MQKRVQTDSNPRLRGGERLEDRRMLASGVAACNLVSQPVTPDTGSAFHQPFVIADALPGKRRHSPRVALFENLEQLPDRYTIHASVRSTIDPITTGCTRLADKRLRTNGLIIFDYQNDRNYKFAGFDARKNLWLIGSRHQNRFVIRDRLREPIEAHKTYDLTLNIEGTYAELLVNGELKLSHTFRSLDSSNQLGLGTLMSKATEFGNIRIRDYFPLSKTVNDSFRTTQGLTELIDVLANDQVPYDVDAILTLPQSEFDLGQAIVVDNQLQFQAHIDRFGEEMIPYNVEDQFGRVVSGELNLSVSSQLPLQFNWDGSALDQLELLEGVHENITTTETPLHRLTGLEILDIGLSPEKFTMTTSVVPHPDNLRTNGGGYLVFDYVDPDHYKYAGIVAGKRTAVIGEVLNGHSFRHRTKFVGKPDNKEYRLKLIVLGNQTRLLINDTQYLSLQFRTDVSSGQLGLKGHRRGSIFKPLSVDNLDPPTAGINAYHKVPVHEDVSLEHLIRIPDDATITSATVPHGTVRIEGNQLVYRSAPHHWGPTIIDYEVEFPDGDTVQRTLPIAPGVSFPVSAKLTPFGYLDSDVPMNDLGFAIHGKGFYQENEYPLPFGGYESVTDYNMLFLNETLPEEFDIVLNSREWESTFEPIIFDYQDQLNYKFVGMSHVESFFEAESLIDNVINAVLFPDRTRWELGEMVNGEERILKVRGKRLNLGSNLNTRVHVRDNFITVYADGTKVTSYEFPESLRYGAVGVYSPVADRTYRTLSIVPPNELVEPDNYNQELQGQLWHESENVVEVQPDSSGMSVHMLPDSFVGPRQIVTHVTTLRNTHDELANGFIAFDYVDDNNFKVAGIQIGAQSMVIGEVIDGQFNALTSFDHTMAVGQEIKLRVFVDSSLVTLTVDDQQEISYDFGDDDLGTQFGYATFVSPAYFKNTSIESDGYSWSWSDE